MRELLLIKFQNNKFIFTRVLKFVINYYYELIMKKMKVLLMIELMF